jgi:hypothetical protein
VPYEGALRPVYPFLIEVTIVRLLPAALLGGSALTSTGLLALHPPFGVMAAVVLGEFAAFALYTWSVTRRQQQGQESALKLVKELHDRRVSIVVEADGRVEIQPVTADEAPPGAQPASDPPQLVPAGWRWIWRKNS